MENENIAKIRAEIGGQGTRFVRNIPFAVRDYYTNQTCFDRAAEQLEAEGRIPVFRRKAIADDGKELPYHCGLYEKINENTI